MSNILMEIETDDNVKLETFVKVTKDLMKKFKANKLYYRYEKTLFVFEDDRVKAISINR